MNTIQEIAAAFAIIALCMIIHYSIKDWRVILDELGYHFKKITSKDRQDA